MKKAPHIVWIMCDQLRADAVGFMGNRFVRTPNLDRLATRGTVFENMFVQSPVSLTSRACMWTSRYLRNLRMANGCPVLDPSEVTLPEVLQRAGYRTGVFGKLHLTPQQYTAETLKKDRPINDAKAFLEAAGYAGIPTDPAKENYGFQEEVGFEDTGALWGEYLDWLAKRGEKLPAWRSEFPGTKLADVGARDLPLALHPSVFMAEAAAEFFTKNHGQSPCFVNLSFVDPHHPFDPPREVAERYSPAEMPLPKFSDTGNVQWPEALAKRMFSYSPLTPEHVQTAIAYYYAMIETADHAVGILLDAIERAGEMENTVFAFIADHGEMLGNYGLWRKGAWHYDCLIRVPSFIAGPGVTAGRVAGLTQAIDVTPTLLNLAGVPVDARMQGENLVGTPGRRWVYSEQYQTLWGPWINCWTVRTPTSKLNYYPSERIGHLFDLATDPDERNDLWASNRRLRDEMLANLLQSQQEQIGPWPRVITQY